MSDHLREWRFYVDDMIGFSEKVFGRRIRKCLGA
jgi:hypothetical protein